MPLCDVNGTRLWYTDTGTSGPAAAIVFSHGLLWSGRMYDAQVAHFRDRYRCVTFDHRGQGQSPRSATPFDMETQADDAAALCTALKLPPCHFVGLSMGGFIGLRLAARRPELLRSLTVMESAADPEPRMNIPKYRAMSLVTRLFGYRPLVGTIMKIMFARPFLTDADRAGEREVMRQRLLALEPDATREALESVLSRKPVAAEELARIRLPTLFLHGAEDAAITPARGRRTAEQIAGARWVTVPRAGHTSTVEEPAAVCRELERFFQDVEVVA